MPPEWDVAQAVPYHCERGTSVQTKRANREKEPKVSKATNSIKTGRGKRKTESQEQIVRTCCGAGYLIKRRHEKREKRECKRTLATESKPAEQHEKRTCQHFHHQ